MSQPRVPHEQAPEQPAAGPPLQWLWTWAFMRCYKHVLMRAAEGYCDEVACCPQLVRLGTTAEGHNRLVETCMCGLP